MSIVKMKFELQGKLIQYITKLIDENMKESTLASDKLELIIQYL